MLAILTHFLLSMMLKLPLSKLVLATSLLGRVIPTTGFVTRSLGIAAREPCPGTQLHLQVSEDSQLAQLASMTTLSIDSGDLDVIREFAATGYSK